jgi:hypothetical protein
MSNYTYMPDDFMPKQTINTVMHYWGFESEEDFISKALSLEGSCIAVIESSVNLKKVLASDNGPNLLSDLCSTFVGAKLFEQVSNNEYEGYVDNLLTGFWDIIKEIKEAQEKASINPDEAREENAPHIMIF